MRQLSREREADHGRAHRPDGVRELPQVHHAPGAGAKVDHSTFTRSDQLRQLPQRHQRDRQERDAHPGRSGQLHRLPQHDRVEAHELEPHPASGHRPMRHLPQRGLSAGRRQERQPRPVSDRGGPGLGQLRQLPQGGLRGLDAGQGARQRHGDGAVRQLPRAASSLPRRCTPARRVCENCHKSTTTWTGAKVDHSTFTVATNCASCHNGTSATGKSATHIPVGATNCIACHNTTAFKPSTWNHTQLPVTAQCATCHSGAYPPADGKSASHIPYQTRGERWPRPTATAATRPATWPGRRPRCTPT